MIGYAFRVLIMTYKLENDLSSSTKCSLRPHSSQQKDIQVVGIFPRHSNGCEKYNKESNQTIILHHHQNYATNMNVKTNSSFSWNYIHMQIREHLYLLLMGNVDFVIC